MDSYADKTRGDKRNTSENQTSQFKDNQPQSLAPDKLQEIESDDSRAVQLKAFKELINNSPKSKQAAQLQSIANNHSHQQQQLIQKKESEEASTNQPIQRLVAWGGTPTVFAPRAIRKFNGGNYDEATYLEGLQVLLGGAPVLGTGEPLGALISDNQIGEDAKQILWQQFNDINKVYVYDAGYQLHAPAPSSEQAIMEPADMGDNSAAVPAGYIEGQACVVQALSMLGVSIPGGAAGTSQQHHDYSVAQGLDYRTDSDFLKLYVDRYDLSLIHSGVVAWNAIPWEDLGGTGDYLATTYPGAVGPIGHMVGVRVTNVDGALNVQVFDFQDVSADALNAGNGSAKYIFSV